VFEHTKELRFETDRKSFFVLATRFTVLKHEGKILIFKMFKIQLSQFHFSAAVMMQK
jgi:hypothetical protein